MIREPEWFEHRLFKGPDTNINLHVFSAGCEETDRMVLFRDWLRGYDADRELYAAAKRELAARDWKYVQQYADAKTAIVAEIMSRAEAARQGERHEGAHHQRHGGRRRHRQVGADDGRRPDVRGGPPLYTEEINAAVRGAKAAGATEIVVMDCHGAGKGWSFNSLIPDLLDPACEFVVQQEWTEYTEFLEQGCDAALFVGMHARAGTRDGVMNHTVSGQSWQNLSFNGTLVGETGINAALCGNWGCPVLLVTGDEAVCREGRELLGESLTTVAVKRGLGAVQRAAAARAARARADRGRSEGGARGSRRRTAVRPGLTVHDRGRVHADGLARRVHAQARRRAHGRAHDHVDR